MDFKRIPFLVEYPKKAVLKDGRTVVLRPMVKDDGDKLYEFFKRVPEEDRMFLRDDVSRRETIDMWVEGINYYNVLPILAFYNNDIVADSTLHASNYFWSRHIGEIRIVVDRDFRGLGLGKVLLRELVIIALKRGFRKIMAQIPFDQPYVIRMFEIFGFEKEAILKRHILKRGGGYGDLVIVSGFAENLWTAVEGFKDFDVSSIDVSSI